jgi:methyl-accepting chemotaxis protein
MASSGSMNDLSEGVGIIGTQINHLNNNIERGLGKSDKIAEELSEITRVLWSISTSLDHINNSISSLEGTLEEGIRKAQL